MRRPGRPDIYSHLIAVLEDRELYSPSSILKNAEENGLFPSDLSPEDIQKYRRNAYNALSRRATRKFKCEPDGTENQDPHNPQDAFFGIRWKSTIDIQFLDEQSKVEVQRFLESGVVSDPDKKKGLFAYLSRNPSPRWFVIVSLAMFTFLFGYWTSAKTSIINEVRSLSQENNYEELRTYLRDPEYRDLHPFIVEKIASSVKASKPTALIVETLENVQAVFAVDGAPFAIMEYQLIQLGDWMTIADHHGYVKEINPTNLVLKTDYGSRDFHFKPCPVMGATYHSLTQVNIYPDGDNLNRILMAISQVGGFEYEANNVTGYVSGKFKATNYESFLNQIADGLGFKVKEDAIRIEPSEDVRAYVGFTQSPFFFEFRLSKILEKFEEQFDIRILNHLEDTDPFIVSPPRQLSNILSELDLTTRPIGPQLIEIGDEP